jgi:octaprenyl-diphosphate synthase
MLASVLAPSEEPRDVLERLRQACAGRDGGLGRRLAAIQEWIAHDLGEVEEDLKALGSEGLAEEAAAHLLERAGKRLRPACVALAARVGRGFGSEARQLAVAAELVHNATLLHDDVIDLGEERRGAPAARVVFGNAASILGGDWLLVEALVRIRKAGIPEALDRKLAVLRSMIAAEALQLARRGRIDARAEDYFRVAEGKTASLFRWSLWAGALAGGAATADRDALERYGQHLGVAFQIIDDALDLGGAPEENGKSVFADVREGKLTYPLLLAVDRDPALGARLSEWCASGSDLDAPLRGEVAAALRRTGALDDARLAAHRFSRTATEALAPLEPGPARTALEVLALALADRSR